MSQVLAPIARRSSMRGALARLVEHYERWFIQSKRNANEHGVTEQAVHE